MAKWSLKLRTYHIKYEPRSAIKSQAHVGFFADFSDDLQDEAELENKELQKEESVGRWKFFTKVSSNFRGTGLGIILKSPQGDIIP